MTFAPGAKGPHPPQPDDALFAFTTEGLIVPAHGAGVVPISALPGGPAPLFVGMLDGRACWATRLESAPSGHAAKGLRGLFRELGEEAWIAAGRASQLLLFHETHRHCGRCGLRTEPVEHEHAVRCPACALVSHPRVSPAIIVLVRRGDRALLARGSRTPAAFHSTLAGFVEPGETLEQAVAREVREEVGVEIHAPRYFGSQPWPFPHSLMLGFIAEHASGEPVPDGTEILEAGWFRADALPPIPPRPSIARRLIDAWLDEVASPRSAGA